MERARDVAAELARQMQRHPEGLMITIEPYTRPKTRSQTAKIHVLINALADHLGYHRADMKEICKREYWPTKEIQLREKSVLIPKSTADLDKSEASLVIDKLMHVIGELEIPLKGD